MASPRCSAVVVDWFDKLLGDGGLALTGTIVCSAAWPWGWPLGVAKIGGQKKHREKCR